MGNRSLATSAPKSPSCCNHVHLLPLRSRPSVSRTPESCPACCNHFPEIQVRASERTRRRGMDPRRRLPLCGPSEGHARCRASEQMSNAAPHRKIPAPRCWPTVRLMLDPNCSLQPAEWGKWCDNRESHRSRTKPGSSTATHPSRHVAPDLFVGRRER